VVRKFSFFSGLPLVVDEEHGGEDEAEADDVIPLDSLTQIEHGEEAEDDESDAFLHDFELGGGLAGKVADAVGGLRKRGRAARGERPCPRLRAELKVCGVAYGRLGTTNLP
jgi:hypothetical protein